MDPSIQFQEQLVIVTAAFGALRLRGASLNIHAMKEDVGSSYNARFPFHESRYLVH